MPCWFSCLLGYWWIWGIGAIAAALIGLASAGPWGLLAGAAWFGIWVVALLIHCLVRCGGR